MQVDFPSRPASPTQSQSRTSPFPHPISSLPPRGGDRHARARASQPPPSPSLPPASPQANLGPRRKERLLLNVGTSGQGFESV